MTSSCGVCGKTSLEAVRVAARHPIPNGVPRIDPGVIRSIPERLREEQALFSETGGLHAAGLFDARGNLGSVREDVGRHNAVDKVIGEAFLADRVPLSDHILAVSGRSSFEIMQKAAVAGIPTVAAGGAPARPAGTLGGEIRLNPRAVAPGGKVHVFARPERIESATPTTPRR